MGRAEGDHTKQTRLKANEISTSGNLTLTCQMNYLSAEETLEQTLFGQGRLLPFPVQIRRYDAIWTKYIQLLETFCIYHLQNNNDKNVRTYYSSAMATHLFLRAARIQNQLPVPVFVAKADNPFSNSPFRSIISQKKTYLILPGNRDTSCCKFMIEIMVRWF